VRDEDIQTAVSEIKLLAETQAMLASQLGGSEITVAVLKEIAERCKTITPAKRVNDVSRMDPEIIGFMEGAVGFCEATREEEHSIWSTLVNHRDPPVTWEQHGGVGMTVGYLDDRPVHVSLSHVDVAGHKVIFYHATSTVVDHDMIRTFIEAIAPQSAWEGPGRLNHTDATNFTNILPRGWQTTKGIES
jgi:hypothetical protein